MEAFRGFQNIERGCHKAAHRVALNASRCVNDQHKLTNALLFAIFQRLNERNVAVEFQAVRIENVVELVLGQAHDFTRCGKLPQERSVIHALMRRLVQIVHKAC